LFNQHKEGCAVFQVKLLNPIAKQGLDLFSDNYAMGTDVQNPDAVLVRSFDMHAIDLPDTVRVVGRAGAGVNNIPIEAYSALGIPVLNTPGANANAVKELVVAGMLMASRNLCAAWDDTKHLQADDNAGLQQQVEQSKKRFKGRELPGRVFDGGWPRAHRLCPSQPPPTHGLATHGL
jgi:D-3-phosphoglycerate dehydrogenase